MRSSSRLSSGMVLGIWPCRCPDTYITHRHTYIHRRIAASRAMLRWSSSVSSRTSIPTDSAPRKCKGANQKLCLLPGMYVCMYVFIRILPTGWEGMPIHTIHAWFSINHWNRSNLVLWYTPMIHWLMVMILIILISLSLSVCLSVHPAFVFQPGVDLFNFIYSCGLIVIICTLQSTITPSSIPLSVVGKSTYGVVVLLTE